MGTGCLVPWVGGLLCVEPKPDSGGVRASHRVVGKAAWIQQVQQQPTVSVVIRRARQQHTVGASVPVFSEHNNNIQ